MDGKILSNFPDEVTALATIIAEAEERVWGRAIEACASTRGGSGSVMCIAAIRACQEEESVTGSLLL
jgi:hypothetical protein